MGSASGSTVQSTCCREEGEAEMREAGQEPTPGIAVPHGDLLSRTQSLPWPSLGPHCLILDRSTYSDMLCPFP